MGKRLRRMKQVVEIEIELLRALIEMVHGFYPCRIGEPGAANDPESSLTRCQAAAFSLGWLPPVPIAILRGFMASGTRRTKSTCNSPFSNEAPCTST